MFKSILSGAVVGVVGIAAWQSTALAGLHADDTPIRITVLEEATVAQAQMRGTHNVGEPGDSIQCTVSGDNDGDIRTYCFIVDFRPDGSSHQKFVSSYSPAVAEAASGLGVLSNLEIWWRNGDVLIESLRVGNASANFSNLPATQPGSGGAACLADWESTSAASLCTNGSIQQDHRDGCTNLLNCWEANDCDAASCSQGIDDVCGQNNVTNFMVAQPYANQVYAELCN